MRIAVVGAGYVGLVAGTCFAETGHDVVLVEVDEQKIQTLQQGQVPFYEPGLSDLLKRNIAKHRLAFSSDIKTAMEGTKAVFIAVGTPQSADGQADLSFVLQVAKQIGQAQNGPIVVVNKSTVPVGTAEKVRRVIGQYSSHPVTVVSNPEFLKEGAAIDDFMRPDRVVIGTDDEQARKLMSDLYAPFVRTGNPILFMDNASAEVTKYAANGLLASRISFMNEIALLCDAVSADVELVRFGVGSDSRIGHPFLFPGVGFGGSCFPKDVRALIRTGKEHDIEMEMLKATDRVNERQKGVISRRIKARFGEDLTGRVFGIWGLAFKPRTDDVREAPALVIINDLLEAGAEIRVYDPEALQTAREILGDRVTYCESSYDCCQAAEALVVVTEWNEFRRPDFERIKSLLKQPVVFDGRNIYDPDRMHELGFEHIAMGRTRSK
ncbi:MAG: UDP-glucose/GDP-mannose dehydrogenase family protein [Deltaproteobacteria bacterium]|nr:UDP-glucose/GDP-mannose dehydrogenase family protein [Deltaproteobacteria bacterium]MBW1871422.1 UDP-glucose/GDP-mannose dehydrogenase family protein [Deltaproteobacteria bacterium]